MSAEVKKVIAKTFEDLANALETGSFGNQPKIGLMVNGSEHGAKEVMAGAALAREKGINTHCINSETEEAAVAEMEQLLERGEIDAAVAMHYTFPIGVATVGKVITPAAGRAMYIATTTGTSATDRVVAMVKNTIYGIIAAKAGGTKNPSVGILNIDGARQVERALKELADKGYPINFAVSNRADGGSVMRGNDVLNNPCDVLVCDSLTGNVLMKLLSSFTTGGKYESLGYGYGPGIGDGIEKLVLIVSRASGAPVIAGATEYAAQLVKGNWRKVLKAELAAANAAGLRSILEKLAEKAPAAEVISAPPKEIVTAEVAGIEITELDNAATALWKAGIYAETGMGCTGPIILISEANKDKAEEILTKNGFL